MTGYRDQPLLFPCEGETLVGMLSAPVRLAKDVGVVVIVGGPQYRAGSHRQFVLLARALASAGYPVLRFDYRGMGDSTGELRSFEQVTPDVGAAIDALLRETPELRKVVLWGLCDGASAALLYLDERADKRVGGLCLVNPWVRTEQSLAIVQVRHYYRDRLRQKAFWIKLLSGRVALAAITGFLGNVRSAIGPRRNRQVSTPIMAFPGRMARAWRSADVPIALFTSTNDLTAQEFMQLSRSEPSWHGLLTGGNVTCEEFREADHTFSQVAARIDMEQATINWLQAVSNDHEQD